MANWRVALLALWPLIWPAPPTRAQSATIVAEEAMLPSGDPGIGIYVRNKHAANRDRFGPDRTLVFVHGATYPASTSFDLELGGTSMMDVLALHGFDVYLLDLPGYGQSTRPVQMQQPAEANPPFETTEDAVRHYAVVVDYVLHRRDLKKLDVMGWSWGTTIAGGFAASQPGKVNRLVLYAPLWVIHEPAPIAGTGAYRSVTPEQARKRWLRGVPQDKAVTLIPPGWFETWQKATWATDPLSAAQTPPVLRAPNGVVLDVQRYWAAGTPTYDPARVTAPVLLVQGEWDHDTPPYMAQTLFGLLTRAAWKQYTMIGEGTHSVIMERNRGQLFDIVRDFLEDDPPR